MDGKALALVGGMAIGGTFSLGMYVARTHDPGARTVEATPLEVGGVTELVAELRTLRESLQRLHERSLSSPPAASREVVPVPGEDPDLEALFARFEARLVELTEAVRKSTGNRVNGLFVSETARDDFEPEPFPPREEYSTDAFSQRHMFWGYQQVLDAYGLPDEIAGNPHGHLVWCYQHDGEDLEFVFHDGFVLRVEW